MEHIKLLQNMKMEQQKKQNTQKIELQIIIMETTVETIIQIMEIVAQIMEIVAQIIVEQTQVIAIKEVEH